MSQNDYNTHVQLGCLIPSLFCAFLIHALATCHNIKVDGISTWHYLWPMASDFMDFTQDKF